MNLKNQRGTSLLEMLFVLAILGLLIGGIVKFFTDSQNAVIDTENRSDLAAISQNMDRNLRQSLLQSQRMLCDLSLQGQPADLFDGYKTRVLAGISASASAAPLPVPWGSLPKVMTEPNLVTGTSGTGTDVAAAMGNSLLFVASVAPLRLTGLPAIMPAGTPSPTPGANAPLSDVVLDRYQFVYVYLSLDSSRSLPNMPGVLRLVEWRSRPYISYGQLSTMPQGAKLTATAQRLAALGYSSAFNFGENDAAEAFYPVTAASPYFVSHTATNQTQFPEQSWAYIEEFNNTQHPDPNPLKPLGRIARNNFTGGVSGYPSRYSIAYNSRDPTVNPGFKVNQLLGGMQGVIDLPVFANPATNTASGFPGGFEVGIFGAAGKRELWIRTVVMAQSAGRGIDAIREKKFPGAEGIVDVTLKNSD